MKLFGLLITTLFFLATRVEGNAEPPICPPGIQEEVQKTPEEVATLRRLAAINTWSLPLTLSSDAQLIRNQFLTMLNGNNADWQLYAAQATLAMSLYLYPPGAVPINLCPMAQLINATPGWAQTGSCADITGPLTRTINQIPGRLLGPYISALSVTGCGKMITDNKGRLKIIPITSNEPGPSPLTTFADTETCENNGRVYNIEPMLTYIGNRFDNVPGATEDFKCIIRRLQQSTDPTDNLIAAFSLAIASPVLAGTSQMYKDNVPTAFFSLGFLTSLPNECCPKYRKDLVAIFTGTIAENKNAIATGLSTYCTS